MDIVGANIYIYLGILIQHLRRGYQLQHIDVCRTIDVLLKELKDLGFEHSLDVSKTLKSIRSQLGKDELELKTLDGSTAKTLADVMEPLKDSIMSEAIQRQTLWLNTEDVSDQLRSLNSLNDTQGYLRDETVLCLECRAYRAAMVMGWNLVFDILRQWIYDDEENRRPAFNNVLTSKQKTKNQKYQAVSDYEDFWHQGISENSVIQWACEAKLLGNKVKRLLEVKLDLRNDYAHPNFKNPTVYQANAYIEELVSIIQDAPFKIK